MVRMAIVIELALACAAAGILVHRLQTVGPDLPALLFAGGLLAAGSISTAHLDRQATEARRAETHSQTEDAP